MGGFNCPGVEKLKPETGARKPELLGCVGNIAYTVTWLMIRAGGEGRQVAFREFGLGDAELLAQLAHALFAGGEVFLEPVLALDGGEVGNGVLMFLAPGDEGIPGDVEFLPPSS